MNRVFQPCLCLFVLVFLMIIWLTAEIYRNTTCSTRTVLSTLETQQLFAQESKCTFAANELLHLGHIISNKGVKVDDTKI